MRKLLLPLLLLGLFLPAHAGFTETDSMVLGHWRITLPREWVTTGLMEGMTLTNFNFTADFGTIKKDSVFPLSNKYVYDIAGAGEVYPNVTAEQKIESYKKEITDYQNTACKKEEMKKVVFGPVQDITLTDGTKAKLMPIYRDECTNWNGTYQYVLFAYNKKKKETLLFAIWYNVYGYRDAWAAENKTSFHPTPISANDPFRKDEATMMAFPIKWFKQVVALK